MFNFSIIQYTMSSNCDSNISAASLPITEATKLAAKVNALKIGAGRGRGRGLRTLPNGTKEAVPQNNANEQKPTNSGKMLHKAEIKHNEDNPIEQQDANLTQDEGDVKPEDENVKREDENVKQEEENVKREEENTKLDEDNINLEKGNVKQEEGNFISAEEKSLLQKVVRKGLIQTKHDLEIKRKDPNSPLYSIKSFEKLHIKPELLKGLYEIGYNYPSKIQETAVPTLLADPPQNMIAQSQSGTGKTAAFAIAMISRINSALNYPQALCLAPTYELAVQIGEEVSKMSMHCQDIKIVYVVKGEEVPPRGSKLKQHIIIGTPGKVCDWAYRYSVFDLSKLTVFVLDEADVMIDKQGHQEQSYRIRKGLSNKCQIMCFSATYDPAVMKFAEMMVPNAIVIRLKREEESLDNIKQFYVNCPNLEKKYEAIVNIYSIATISQAIIFCQTKKTALWLSEKMTYDGHAVALLTGDLTVEQRITILDGFRDNKEKVLITTNVLARGIDIETVSIVVNFDLPVDQYGRPDCETYLHRIGRTGRFGKDGIAINLVENEHGLNILKQIENHFGVNIKLLDTNDLDQMEENLEKR